MSNKQLPIVRIALSELLTPQKSNVSIDVDFSIDEANQQLLKKSYSEVNPDNKTHTPYYHTGALAQALSTDLRAFREAIAEADRDEIRQQNGHIFLSQGLALEIIDERYEQPRDTKQQVKHAATSQLIADVAVIPYQTVAAISSLQATENREQQTEEQTKDKDDV
ncbi:hypothetical protein L2725_04415 [Shewanella corallii]|uniref:Uncharacterized protein n=1 Tax=Shewanella corallii TaxID=560080 RepID=A0ABT0N3M0_9GAMM|nr:hypothetical protein [Shewanella corallii]MCL2913029.1 hypothetical protein [Shewanella corallii]